MGSDCRLHSPHFVAQADEQAGKLVALGNGVFESGNWAVTESIVSLARGAILHLHERQSDRSLCCRQREGWGQDQARVWKEDDLP